MKLLRNWIYPGIILVIFLTACGPGTATPINDNLIPFPDVIVTVVPPVLAVACIPPVPAIGDVTSFCADQAAGQGGVTFVYHPDQSMMNFTTGGPGDLSCDFSDSANNKVACSGTKNQEFQEVICTACRSPEAPDTFGTFICADGYVKNANGECAANDSSANPLCPSASHYDNNKQKCVNDASGTPISLCPPGYPTYLPDFHYCLKNAYPIVYNCQTFTVQLGACVASKPDNFPITIVPYCLNKGANIGGANITIPAGYTLATNTNDTRYICTHVEPQSDTENKWTCWGPSGDKISTGVTGFAPDSPNGSLQIEIVLGTCPVKNNQDNNQDPVPVPTCVHC